MRSLKFKAWDRKLKIWCSTEPFHLIGEWTVFDCLNQYIESDFIKRLNDIEIVQYTGLKDKNDKEIYEGDICKYYDEFYEEEVIRKIVFIEGCFMLEKWLDLYQINSELEVIGNIYENKELLNV